MPQAALVALAPSPAPAAVVRRPRARPRRPAEDPGAPTQGAALSLPALDERR